MFGGGRSHQLCLRLLREFQSSLRAGVLAHVYNSSMRAAEAEGSQVVDQPGVAKFI